MDKTSTFFVIDNYNMVPDEILNYCENYVIYDASTDPLVEEKIKANGLNYIKIPRTGHNLSTYFQYFVDNYDNLPDVMCLTKGHMIGRHCSKEFFNKVYNNKYFTYLYEDRNHIPEMNPDVSFLTMENQYLEKNSSWYVYSPNHPHRYFFNLNDLLQFIYVNPVIPNYVTFAPGGCYIVLREQVLKHTREFYLNLNKIMTYGLNPNFPTEAHMVERIMPIIFEANYETNEWMDDFQAFDERLEFEKLKIQKLDERRNETYKQKILRKLKEVLLNKTKE